MSVTKKRELPIDPIAADRAPDWRHQRAQHYVRAGRAPAHEDEHTRALWSLLAAKERGGEVVVTPAEEQAWALFADQDETRRAILEARLLAREPVPDVAEKLGLDTAVVETFIAWFFDVLDRLGDSDFIERNVVAGFEPRLGSLLRSVGYHTTRLLDGIIDYLELDQGFDPSIVQKKNDRRSLFLRRRLLRLLVPTEKLPLGILLWLAASDAAVEAGAATEVEEAMLLERLVSVIRQFFSERQLAKYPLLVALLQPLPRRPAPLSAPSAPRVGGLAAAKEVSAMSAVIQDTLIERPRPLQGEERAAPKTMTKTPPPAAKPAEASVADPAAPSNLVDLCLDSPFRPPDWRYQLAQAWLHAGRPLDRELFDEPAGVAYDFLAAQAGDRSYEPSAEEKAAWDIFTAPDLMRRAILEAHLLTGVDIPTVAWKLRLPEEVVRTYESWFFHVSDCLGKRIYIGLYALSLFPVPRPTIENLLRCLGYLYGAATLDVFLDIVAPEGAPIDLQQLRVDDELTFDMRTTILALLLPPITDEQHGFTLAEMVAGLQAAEEREAPARELRALEVAYYRAAFPATMVAQNELLQALLGTEKRGLAMDANGTNGKQPAKPSVSVMLAELAEKGDFLEIMATMKSAPRGTVHLPLAFSFLKAALKKAITNDRLAALDALFQEAIAFNGYVMLRLQLESMSVLEEATSHSSQAPAVRDLLDSRIFSDLKDLQQNVAALAQTWAATARLWELAQAKRESLALPRLRRTSPKSVEFSPSTLASNGRYCE